MQRRELPRQESKMAALALLPATLSLMLALMATGLHWLAVLASRDYMIVLFLAFVFACVASIAALLGIRALWKDAATGVSKSAKALLLSAPVLFLGAAAFIAYQVTPTISDVSTDAEDPPHYTVLAADHRFTNSLEPPRIVAAGQAAYSGLTGRRYALSADLIADQVYELVIANGWTPAAPLPLRLGASEWVVEASVRTPLLGFLDAVVVRVSDEGESAFVDVRSTSGFGRADLGVNARRIRAFMADLDTRIGLGNQSES